MIRCGVDIIEISRIRQAVEKNNGFLRKVFSEYEIEYFKACGSRYETLAGFFAAKEAFSKFKTSGIRGLELSEISVEHEKLGAPFVVFRGKKQAVSLSISHNKTQAIAVVCGDDGSLDLPCNSEMGKLIPERSSDAHKGDCGRIFIIAGSEGMSGAAVLSARGALRSGAGLVTVGTAASERAVVAVGVCEAMTVGLDAEKGKIVSRSANKILEVAAKSDCVVFGPGLGQNVHMHGILKELLVGYEGKLVIDADGLNALSENCDILNEKRCSVVVTPHPGEMARLAKTTIGEIQRNRELYALELAQKYGICVVLKGENTVVAESGITPNECKLYVNSSGNPGMATGGTGDVLSGVIASFIGQGLDAFDASSLGAYIHGKAGDIAAQKIGIHGVTAGDVARCVALAIKDEFENKNKR